MNDQQPQEELTPEQMRMRMVITWMTVMIGTGLEAGITPIEIQAALSQANVHRILTGLMQAREQANQPK
jgi:uncharacterized protein